MKKLYVIFLTISFCCVSEFCFPQKNITKQEMIWGIYSLKLQASPKLTFGAYHEERYLLPFSIHHRISMASVYYKINDDWTIAYDQMVFFLYNPQEGIENNVVNMQELRPRQSITYHPKPLGKWGFKNRFMMEERFKKKREGDNFQDDYSFNWRFRYRFSGSRPLIYAKQGEKKISLSFSGEILLNFGENIISTFNQTRVFVGGNYHFNPNLTLRAGYLHWFMQKNTGAEYVRWDALSISLFQKIKLYK